MDQLQASTSASLWGLLGNYQRHPHRCPKLRKARVTLVHHRVASSRRIARPFVVLIVSILFDHSGILYYRCGLSSSTFLGPRELSKEEDAVVNVSCVEFSRPSGVAMRELLSFSWLIISPKCAAQALEEDEHPGRETFWQLRKGFVPPTAVAAGVFVIPQHGEMMSGGHFWIKCRNPSVCFSKSPPINNSCMPLVGGHNCGRAPLNTALITVPSAGISA